MHASSARLEGSHSSHYRFYHEITLDLVESVVTVHPQSLYKHIQIVSPFITFSIFIVIYNNIGIAIHRC